MLSALPSNPCRDVAMISTKPNKQPTSPSVEDVTKIRAWFSTDKKATDRDLPDLVAFMLGTGLRIGEACAVCWPDVDLQGRTVAVRGTVLFAAVRPRIPVRTAKQFHQLDVTGELRADVHRAVAALRERRERAPHARAASTTQARGLLEYLIGERCPSPKGEGARTGDPPGHKIDDRLVPQASSRPR